MVTALPKIDLTPLREGSFADKRAVARSIDEAWVKSLEGWKFQSPQGPIMIDPQTRDIVMNEYLDEVYKGSDGRLHQKVRETIPNVKDECKALEFGPCKPKK